MTRMEAIARGDGEPTMELAPGVVVRLLVSGQRGARGLATATANFQPGARLAYHTHPVSEAMVVLQGRAEVLVEGRRYLLAPLDALHVPAQTAHAVHNALADGPTLLHTSFASEAPTRDPVAATYPVVDRTETDETCPEHVTRFEKAAVYELAAGAHFRDLFSRRIGSRGICGGYGIFEPGSGLPCHYHNFDESITIILGSAVCQVAGKEYTLSNCDTACVPTGRPHRFRNDSTKAMAMIWVYAGDEPDRVIVGQEFCDGIAAATG